MNGMFFMKFYDYIVFPFHTVTRRTRKRTSGSERERESGIGKLLVEALKSPILPAPPPPSEDELFLKSLVLPCKDCQISDS